jgi:hypothetical protein
MYRSYLGWEGTHFHCLVVTYCPILFTEAYPSGHRVQNRPNAEFTL